MLTVAQLEYAPRGLGPIDLVLHAGQLVMLCGPSGSGKSTLGQLLRSDLEATAGHVAWQTPGSVGYLSHDAESQLLGATVGQELEIGEARPVTNGCLPSLASRRLLRERFCQRESEDPQTLSVGEQQLLLLTSLVSSDIQLLILDEAVSCLDGSAFEEVCRALRLLTQDGLAVLVISHELRMVPWCDRCLGLVDGKLAFDRPLAELVWSELRAARIWLGSLSGQVSDRARVVDPPLESPQAVLGDTAKAPRGLPLLLRGEDEFSLPRGWTLAVAGVSGSGKSRLLATLLGSDRWSEWASQLTGECYRALLPQNADCILWRRTVAAELAASSAEGRRRRADLTDFLGIESAVPSSWRERSPRALSHGQVKYLAAICLLLQSPDTLLLDEPFSGLDSDLRSALLLRVTSYLKAGGRVVMATHHPDEMVLYAQRLLVLEGGVPVWFEPGWDFFRQHPHSRLGRPALLDWETSSARDGRDGGRP